MDQRAYRHRECGEVTIVTDENFRNLCDPFELVACTFCVNCDDMVSLKDVEWTDTGESVVEFRERMYGLVPATVRRVEGFSCLISLIMIGAAYLIGSVLGSLFVPLGYEVLFGVLAVVVCVMVFSLGKSRLIERVSGIKFHEQE